MGGTISSVGHPVPWDPTTMNSPTHSAVRTGPTLGAEVGLCWLIDLYRPKWVNSYHIITRYITTLWVCKIQLRVDEIIKLLILKKKYSWAPKKYRSIWSQYTLTRTATANTLQKEKDLARSIFGVTINVVGALFSRIHTTLSNRT